MNRNERIKLAQQTLQIIEQGDYRSPTGACISIQEQLQLCLNQTELYTPEALDVMTRRELANRSESTTLIEIVNETTLNGARRLVTEEGYMRVGVLNFASARNPGGGFLGGSQAQEESLARSSGLYASLQNCPEYYKFHRSVKSGLYTDRMIYSPSCPVFMDDDGALLEEPYLVDFVTSPAPNAGAITHNTPEQIDAIPACFEQRVHKLLALFADRDCDALVLGAWGCGVFRNDPEMVAQCFARYVGDAGIFAGRFKKILFSVYDATEGERIFKAFEVAFKDCANQGGNQK